MDTNDRQGGKHLEPLGAAAAMAAMAGTLCFAALAGIRLAQGLHAEAAADGALAVIAATAAWRCLWTAREQ